MTDPPKQAQAIRRGSVVAVIDAFLEWCQKHRAPENYEWYRDRLQRIAKKHPTTRATELRPYHVQEWIADMELPKAGKREMVISEDEFNRILQRVPDRSLRDLLITTWETGCRPPSSRATDTFSVISIVPAWLASFADRFPQHIGHRLCCPSHLGICRRRNGFMPH